MRRLLAATAILPCAIVVWLAFLTANPKHANLGVSAQSGISRAPVADDRASTRPRTKSTRKHLAAPDPLRVVQSAERPDPPLEAWVARNIQLPIPDAVPSVSAEEELRSILQNTSLTPVELLELAHNYHSLTVQPSFSAEIYDAASRRAESVLSQPETTASERLEIVLALRKHLQDYKKLMWQMIDDRNDTIYAQTLFRLYNLFVQYVPRDNPKLVEDSYHPAIGAAECLHVMGRDDEAIRYLHSVPVDRLATGERTAWDWALAFILFGEARYDDCVGPLEDILARKDATHREWAARMLPIVYARLNRAEDATRALSAWRTAYHPDLAEIEAIVLEMKTRQGEPAGRAAATSQPIGSHF